MTLSSISEHEAPEGSGAPLALYHQLEMLSAMMGAILEIKLIIESALGERPRISPWLTVRESAEFIRCRPRQIEKLIAEGYLPVSRQNPMALKSPRLIHIKHLTTLVVTGKNPIRTRLTANERLQVEELMWPPCLRK